MKQLTLENLDLLINAIKQNETLTFTYTLLLRFITPDILPTVIAREVMVSEVPVLVSVSITLDCLHAASLLFVCIITFTIARPSSKIKGMWPILHIWEPYLFILCHIYDNTSWNSCVGTSNFTHMCILHTMHMNTNNLDSIWSILLWQPFVPFLPRLCQ